MIKNIKDNLAIIEGFPKKGISFYDICPLMYNPVIWKETIEEISKLVNKYKPDVIVALEARGFVLGAPVAFNLNTSFVMIRKSGKLPGEIISYTYDLEYGQDTLQIQKNSIKKDQKILILDDVVATSGTMLAAYELVNKCLGKVVAGVALLEITGLQPRNKIEKLFPLDTLIKV